MKKFRSFKAQRYIKNARIMVDTLHGIDKADSEVIERRAKVKKLFGQLKYMTVEEAAAALKSDEEEESKALKRALRISRSWDRKKKKPEMRRLEELGEKVSKLGQ